MRSIRISPVIKIGAVAAAAAMGLAACSSGGSGTNANGSVKLTWWNNATADPLKTVFKQLADQYHAAHPKATIAITPIQNEQFTTKIPVALRGNNPPNLYQQWGGGNLATQIQSGKVMDLTSATSSWIGEIGKAAAGWQANGRQYGIPYDLHAVGFWYRKDLFARAGITSPPATMNELTADVAKLKAAHIVPIAIGSKDKWPDAFYWDYFAVRECSQSVLQHDIKAIKLSDPCFTKAGQDLKSFMAIHPFQPGFLSTPAQQGAGSSAGMLANGKAAMELQGDWDPSVFASLASNKNYATHLGWFSFPALSGAAGSQQALLGGGDGFSCTVGSPPACVDFLKFLASPSSQKKLVSNNAGLPVNPAATSAFTSPTLQKVFQTYQTAPFVQTYFDIALPTNVGQALDDAVANFFAGKGTPQSIVQQTNQAAATQ